MLATDPESIRLVPIYVNGWIVDYRVEVDEELDSTSLAARVKREREQELSLF